MAVRRRYIRQVVERLLEMHAKGRPPTRIDLIARACGAKIAYVPAEAGLSGFLLRRPGAEGVIIGINQADTLTRQRFTIAHELGHFFLHAPEELHVDRASSVFLRNLKSSEGVDEKEMEANLFAAELLMPREWLQSDLTQMGHFDVGSESQLRELARRYEVSPQAMTIRLMNFAQLPRW